MGLHCTCGRVMALGLAYALVSCTLHPVILQRIAADSPSLHFTFSCFAWSMHLYHALRIDYLAPSTCTACFVAGSSGQSEFIACIFQPATIQPVLVQSIFGKRDCAKALLLFEVLWSAMPSPKLFPLLEHSQGFGSLLLPVRPAGRQPCRAESVVPST